MPRSFSGGFRPRPDLKLFHVHHEPEKLFKEADGCSSPVTDPRALEELQDWVDTILEQDATDLVDYTVSNQHAEVDVAIPIPDQLPAMLSGEDGAPNLTPLLEQSNMWGSINPWAPIAGMQPAAIFSGPGSKVETGVAVPEAAAPQADTTMDVADAKTKANAQPTFEWYELERSVVAEDMRGHQIEACAIRKSGDGGGLKMTVTPTPPFLYWLARRTWMWHRKWMLPTLTVYVEATTEEALASAASRSLMVMVTAGTLDEGSSSLENAGLSGPESQGRQCQCQRRITLDASGRGTVEFSHLLFKHTSFKCGAKPFHLIVTLLSDNEEGEGAGAAAGRAEATQLAMHEEVGATPTTAEMAEMAKARIELRAPAPATDDAMDIEGPHAPFPMPATTHAPPPKAVGVRVVPLVCLKSNPIHVDARKRDEGERVNKVGPDDVRFLQRQSAGAASGGSHSKAPSVPVPAAANNAGSSSSAAHLMPPPVLPRPGTLPAHGDFWADHPDDAVFEMSFDTVVLGFQSSVVYGYTAKELIGQSLFVLTVPAQRPQLQSALETMKLTEKIVGASGGGPRGRGPSIRIVHDVIIGLGNPMGQPSIVQVSSRLTLVSGTFGQSKLLVRSRHAVGPERLGGFQLQLPP